MDIWKSCKGAKHLTNINTEICRIIEDQSKSSTRDLVDDLHEHDILEEILETSKPPMPTHNSRGKITWLLATPFRYAPLKGGGRFHSIDEQSIFYGSLKMETAMAEIAYKRFVFRENTKAKLVPSTIEYTKFNAKVDTKNGIDLTSAPFKKHTSKISNPISHDDSQILGRSMRKEDVEAFLFYSARVRDEVNCGLISTEAFANNKHYGEESWTLFDSKEVVEFYKKLPMQKGKKLAFGRSLFLVDGQLPLFS